VITCALLSATLPSLAVLLAKLSIPISILPSRF
jgi:hypothetical protein